MMWREGLALIFVLCTHTLISAQSTDHLRPSFVNYMDADTLTRIYGSTAGPAYVNALEPGLTLPLITPPDDYQFAVNLGETTEFFVIGQWSDGNLPVGTGLSLGVLFEEPSSLWQGDPECQSTPQSERACVTQPDTSEWCACEALETAVPDGRLANKVFSDVFPNDNRRFGKYSFTARRWRPRRELQVCFRVLDCSPSAPQGDPQACELDASGAFDRRFYPQRCVSVTVLQPPSIYAVHPLNPNHRVAGTETSVAGAQPWYSATETVDAQAREGELLELAVDAWDVNEEDDVDVRLAASSAALPPGAALGPRLCCSEDFSECEERAAGAQDCPQVCQADCGAVSVVNQTVLASCAEACSQRCAAHPCRYVRRVLQYLGPAVSVADLKFEAFDDSHRLNRFRQTDRSTYPQPPACCNATSLVSPPSPPVSVTIGAAVPTFAFPSPKHNTIVAAHVGCAMPATAVYAVSPDRAVQLLPQGCAPGSVVRSQVCVEEACSARTDCCCATPPRVCSLCLPDAPEGMDISGPLPYTIPLHPLASVAAEDIPVFHILGAVAEAAGSSRAVFRVRLNAAAPHASELLIHNLLPLNASHLALAPWPQQPSHLALAALLPGDNPELISWHPATGELRVRMHRAGPPSTDLAIEWTGAAVGWANFSGVRISVQGAAVDPARFLPVWTGSAAASGCLNCSAGVPLLGHASPNAGSGAMRLVRWTPRMEDMGQTYHVCFRALGANTSEAALNLAPHRCLVIQVERCRYCVAPGETFESIAGALGTDWRQLWSANAMLPAPLPVDALTPGQVIHIGPVHRVWEPKKLSTIAVELATTEAKLRSVNRDIPPEQLWLAGGQHVCVLVGVCDSEVAADGSGRVEPAPPAPPAQE